MLRNFKYSNIIFKKKTEGNFLVIRGEITNKSGRNYQAMVFRLTLFIKSIPIGNTNITINGFYNGQTRTFEKQVEELEYDRVIKDITDYNIYPESGY